MLFHQIITMLIVFVMTLTLPSSVETKTISPISPISPLSPCYSRASNLITDRITGKQLKHWYAIKRLALAEGADRQPLHPTLQRLWRWAENGRHAIYIELITGSGELGATAGRFRIVKLDPRGRRHISLIQLYLNTIDQAYIGPEVARSDGLIPMKGLSKYERYAEVLGHELAHAYHILNDLERVHKVYELVEETNILLLAQNMNRRLSQQDTLDPDMLRRLEKRDLLLNELEPYAERVETAVWRELLASQKLRASIRRNDDPAKDQLPECSNAVFAMEP